MGTHPGVCSDVTALVIKREDINFYFLCVGSLIYAGYDDCELLCVIPEKMTKDLTEEIEHITKERDADLELMKQLKDYSK